MIWHGWTEEACATLSEMAAKNKSAREIALAINAPSRSAVIGRANRAGVKLAGGGNPEQILRRAEERKKAVETRMARENARRERREAMTREGFERITLGNHVKLHTVKIEVPKFVECSPRVWTSREFGECAFPVDGEGADTRSCCNPVKVGSYCEGHRAVVSTVAAKPSRNLGWMNLSSGEFRSTATRTVTDETEFFC